jgi:16S rRNA (guanine527-N7)-methyltransferase
MEIILKYFPDLPAHPRELLAALDALYHEWNARINVISRKDIDQLYERHILHSLALAKIITFAPGTRIIDIGTGGGFPGIPLAILFPECEFILVDSIRKKIRVVSEIARSLDLANVSTRNERAEQMDIKADFIASRAVAVFPSFCKKFSRLIKASATNTMHAGIFYYMGGDLEKELGTYYPKVTLFPVYNLFPEPFFETKKIVYLPIDK